MYKNIIVPISSDQDRDKAGAAKVAQEIMNEGGQITFVHVLEPIPANVAAEIPPEVFTKHRESAQTMLEEAQGTVPGSKSVLLEGSAGRAITDWAGKNDVDCIVMASHRPAFSDIFIGSTAAWVVRHAACAVHVIR